MSLNGEAFATDDRLKDEVHLPEFETIEDGRPKFLSEKRLDLLGFFCGGVVGGVGSEKSIVRESSGRSRKPGN